ncbi:hypothetical protein CRG98_022488 [Punica granatum]|uniref:Uncharacterized protein n=1 Tax=Punica granatum TaxID=22663 RepID=A0A2I0JLK7_PUNGR|nr:hypothetical protein CRG98_022488 [Punica granatum]
MNKIVTLGSRILRGPGIPKGNDQVIYSNTIPDRLYYRTQLSKADSSSSTAGDQARNPSSLRQPTPTEGRKRRGVLQAGRTTAYSDFRPLGIRRRSTTKLESLIARLGHPQQTTIAPATKLVSGRAMSNCPSGKADFRQIKHTATPRAKQRRNNFIAAVTPIYSRSAPLGQHQPCTLSAHHCPHD